MDDADSADELRRQLEDVRRSRSRVTAAADAERRSIERGLHDGVQQDLIALAVNLQLARELTDSDPAATKSLLEESARDVHDALDRVRALAQGIYPPLLADRGLADALRGAAWNASVPTQIEAAKDRYSPDVEAAVYFSCVLMLESVELSRPAVRATVRVWPEDSSLFFEVVVDGGGAGPPGPTLTSVEDRLGAVAGTLSVFSEPAGYRLLGAIPLDR